MQAGLDKPLTAPRLMWYQQLHGRKQGSNGISKSEHGRTPKQPLDVHGK